MPIKTAPKAKGAPGKYSGVPGLVKNEKVFVIKGGPIMDVALATLVSAPCNSPCSVGETVPDIIDCKAGPANPPNA